MNGFIELKSGGDNEFCKRAIENGYQIYYNENLLINHPLRGSYIEHIRKTKRLGIGHGELFKLKKTNFIQRLIFIIKTTIGVIIPFHQLSLFLKIILNEKISIKNFFPLLKLCFMVGSIQRIEILKKSI